MTDTVLCITWLDSSCAPSTAVYTTEEAQRDTDLVRLEVVGWLVFEDEERVCLAASRHGEEDWRGLQSIPKVNIVGRKELKR